MRYFCSVVIVCIKQYKFYFYKEIHTMVLTNQELQHLLSSLSDSEQ